MFVSQQEALIMRAGTLYTLAGTILFAVVSPALATITQFDLVGKAGPGLLPGNQNTVISGVPGSGGEVGAGISFNDSTNQLLVNLGWGSGNGFTNLSGNANGFHIHGATASSAPASYNEDAGVIIPLDSLPGFNASATSGGLTNTTVTLTATQATQLFAGRLYINVHTPTNGGGEIRGNLLPVPEPAIGGLIALVAIPMGMRRRRSS
jgi:hypothetical protein